MPAGKGKVGILDEDLEGGSRRQHTVRIAVERAARQVLVAEAQHASRPRLRQVEVVVVDREHPRIAESARAVDVVRPNAPRVGAVYDAVGRVVGREPLDQTAGVGHGIWP